MVAANLSSYTDASSVSAYAQQAMAWAMHDGIITGYTATTLRPTRGGYPCAGGNYFDALCGKYCSSLNSWDR